jgi:hypothetical protein
MYYQLLLVPLMFLPLCILYPIVKRNLPIKSYSLKPLSKYNFIWVVVIALSFLNIFAFLNLAPGLPMRVLQSFVGYPMWLPIVAAGIVGSLLETLFFQGALYSDYRNRNISIWHTAIMVSIFATLVHVHPIQFMLVMAVQRVIGVFMMHWTKSLWSAILMNIFILTGIIVFYFGVVSIENQTIFRFVFGVLSLISSPVILWGLKMLKEEHARSYPSDVKEIYEKSFLESFNWLFWILAAFWVFMYMQFIISQVTAS